MALSASTWRPAWRLSKKRHLPVTSLLRPLSLFGIPLYPLRDIDFPIIEKCPAPACVCAPTPEGLDIERKKSLLNTKPPYDKHLVLCTGRADWTPRIESDTGDYSFAKELKGLLGPKSRFSNPLLRQLNILVTNSSLAPLNNSPLFTSAYLFPDFKHFSQIGSKGNNLEEFAASVRQPPALPTKLIKDINQVIIFICGHGNRDQRCGVMGPILEAEFGRALTEAGMNVFPADDSSAPTEADLDHKLSARVALISHIGGHKWAGNVIVYIPPKFKVGGSNGAITSELAGRGIWYGRVEPKHVEGIVKETILGGKVIKELFRGASEPKVVADADEAGTR